MYLLVQEFSVSVKARFLHLRRNSGSIYSNTSAVDYRDRTGKARQMDGTNSNNLLVTWFVELARQNNGNVCLTLPDMRFFGTDLHTSGQ